MKTVRLYRTLSFMFLASAASLLPLTAMADFPDNLSIVWARTKGKTGTTDDKAPIYRQKSTKSKVISNFPHGRTLLITGMEPDKNGEDWYEVSWPFKGWLQPSKTWFAPQVKGYFPENLPLPHRLFMRVTIDVGNYPEASHKIFGKPRDANYSVQSGISVTQTLCWKGMTVEYLNFSRKIEDAEISRITLYKGAKTGFGPIHIGDPVKKLTLIGVEVPQEPTGEIIAGNEEYRYRFTFDDGKISTMSYCYRDKGFIDAP